MKAFYNHDDVTIYNADCLDLLPELATDSVDLIFVDWPYYKVKNEPWDRQWDKPDKFLAWLGQTLEQARRVLKPNGSFYGCASPKMAWNVESVVREWFTVLNQIRWIKEGENIDRRHVAQVVDKGLARTFLPTWEAVIFAEQFWTDEQAAGESGYYSQCDKLRGFVFEPLRAYLDGERRRAGLSRSQAGLIFAPPPHGEALANHFWRQGQWMLPTKENYEKLRRGFNNGHIEYFRREYEDLRREYEDLRRPFNGNPDAPYTDVWTFAPVKDYPGKHPTEKPLAMLEHVISISSKPGATVLDFCMGTGTTLVAARNLGRKAIGIDAYGPYCEQAVKRLSQPTLFKMMTHLNGKQPQSEQLELIA